ncbi:DNA-3-methyladenine glycosylase 2 family protein [uncultured Hydrogenophaga sp.]|uniref:DNA-3-methyladenine glycosylase 2 family protein n=1 Tax=uncultured Hydrogenophaga sp. TaxID=199683 RepID=UPI0026600E51|nr:AlkA N-terminal domain-containing protein [uncultured Hydrogenophaga sp.]
MSLHSRSAPPPPAETAGADDARYLALCSRDRRFDGRFFTGITSTGIYCRPVCAVRTPRRENCRFFDHAAQAEHAGFRPCLRCRPELAPADRCWSTQDAGDILMRHALRWLDDPAQHQASDGSTLAQLAERLGVSDRHLRRVFARHLGVSPLRVLQTRRLLCAKQLLTDTGLPVAEVSQAAGFGSLRRFHAAFRQHYGLSPLQVRASGARARQPGVVWLGWRPPLDVDGLLGFLAARALPGVEVVRRSDGVYARTLSLAVAGRTHAGWCALRFEPERDRVGLQVSDGLLPALPAVMVRLRALLDLDADPAAIAAVLEPAFPDAGGLRVPGAVDGFELATRAILGQQVTVAAARTFATRVVEAFGQPCPDRTDAPAGLERLFPAASRFLEADAAEQLGQAGVVRQRQQAIIALAQAVVHGGLDLSPHAPLSATLSALQALPGIGPWTAHYIAMRALRWPDAWLPGDVVLLEALAPRAHGERPRERQRHADQTASAWQPWRSYAVIRLWADQSPASVAS